jgi:arylsulfatase A-like enzyme
MLDLLAAINGEHFERNPAERELAARIESFELAYRMQTAAPEALDLSKETAETQALYGLANEKCAHFGRQCLTARRMVERGVRFVQIYSGGMENERSWDGHQDIVKNHGGFAAETDTPVAGLLTDLKRMGLLDSTLVIWGGEFGRLPICQKGSTGRDHNPHAFTVWMAGGGVKGGVSHGATDEVGFKAVERKVSVHDLHATILHLLGLDHERLTFRYAGRDFRLTDVAGNVVGEVLA